MFCSDTRQNSTVVVKCRGVRQHTDSIQIVTEAVRFSVVPKTDACWTSCVSRKKFHTTVLLVAVLLNSSGRFKQMGAQTH